MSTPGTPQKPDEKTQQNEPGSVSPTGPADHSFRARGEYGSANQSNSNVWLVSFGDLTALMLTFFVMLFATRDMDMEKISQVLDPAGGRGLHKAPSDQYSGGDQKGANIKRVEYGEALDLTYLHDVLKRSLNQAGLEKDVEIKQARDHLRLIVLTPDGDHGAQVARRLGERLTLLPNRITVIGVPSRWSSGDWASSVAQGAAFAAQMKDGGYRKRLTVIGVGEGAGPGVEIRVEADDGRVQ